MEIKRQQPATSRKSPATKYSARSAKRAFTWTLPVSASALRSVRIVRLRKTFGAVQLGKQSVVAGRAGEHTNGSVRPGGHSSFRVGGTYVTVPSIHKSGYATVSHSFTVP